MKFHIFFLFCCLILLSCTKNNVQKKKFIKKKQIATNQRIIDGHFPKILYKPQNKLIIPEFLQHDIEFEED